MTRSYPFQLKTQYKRSFQNDAFLFTYQNNLTEVILSDNAFLYEINGVHDEVVPLPNGS